MEKKVVELKDTELDMVVGGATAKIKWTWNKKKTYTVKKGDSLWGIANKIGISYSTLKNHNLQIANPRLIHIGDKINVPDQAKI